MSPLRALGRTRRPGRASAGPRIAAAVFAALVALAAQSASAVTLTFRDGESGYAGAADTYIEQASPNTEFGSSSIIRWDGEHPTGVAQVDYVLLRFDGVIGPGPGQVPMGTTITSATLTYYVNNPGNAGELYEANVPWDESTTFASYCGASVCDGTQIGAFVGIAPGGGLGYRSVDVTPSVQGWSSGIENLGWIIAPTGTDGVEILAREAVSISARPVLTVTYGGAGILPREPYLQMGTPGSMTIVWRTDTATDSRVSYGTSPGIYDHVVTDGTVSPDHRVTFTGLASGTRYYYEVGSSTAFQFGGTETYYFETSPPTGSTGPFRVWILGDSGDGGAAQYAVRDAMLAATAADPPDLLAHMGDIAYSTGTETEFTNHHFTPYREILRHTVTWPTLGNHEGASTSSGAPGPSAGPYYTAFVLPAAGEAGGAPSGTEAYYSFDYANVHFVSLNSFQVSRSATGAMAAWLQTDLAANTLPWVVAFWHHPPYTHGSHNSDVEIEHIQMRENLLPILEAGGVDLVLGGHSHTYERSFLIDGATMTPTPDQATLISGGYILDAGDGRPEGNGPYRKDPGIEPNGGAVYVVAGHGGAGVGGTLDHPAMYYSEAVNGSVIMDVSDDTITLRNVRGTGAISDTVTLVKKYPAPLVASVGPLRSATVQNLTSVDVTFDAAVIGVDAGDLTVNGIAAASVDALAADHYLFHLALAPSDGPAAVVLAPGGITGVERTLDFAGDAWQYTIGSECGNEVTGLRLAADKQAIRWDPTAGPSGTYDLARGRLQDFPVGSGADVCLVSGSAVPSAADGAAPPAGQGFWYLARGRNSCTPGSWGFEGAGGQPGAPRTTAACP